jgi:hypothetical protein
MIAHAELLYLPVLSPVRVEVDARPLTQQRAPARQSWRPRIYRVPPRPAAEGIAYGPDGTMAKTQMTGRAIDLFV